MRRRRNVFLIFALIILGLAAIGSAVHGFPRLMLELHPPHTASASRASIDKALAQEIAGELSQAPPQDADGALKTALRLTGRHLHFGLSHKTQLSFSNTEREANCIEYAHLFTKIFSLAAKAAGLSFKVYAVHSAHANVLGARLPMPGWQDHDWVLIELSPGGAESKRLYVDPTLHDAGLGWNIEESVKGTIVLPK